ncbi:MAG: hypothetical protein ACI3W7_09260 [Oscillospiraceae bacterium]
MSQERDALRTTISKEETDGNDKELRVYVKYSFGREYRFCCLICNRVEQEGNSFVLYKDGAVIGQFDRGELDIFYYTQAEKQEVNQR